LANSLTQLAEHFITSLNTLKNTQADFDKLFVHVYKQKDVLQHYSVKTTEANYIEKSEDFLNSKAEYIQAITMVIKAEKFIKKNLDKIKGFSRFVTAVNSELEKAGIKNNKVTEAARAFETAMADDVIGKFGDIQNGAQLIKDEYYQLMSSNAQVMNNYYTSLKSEIQSATKELKENYPANLNNENELKLNNLLSFCSGKTIAGVRLEYHIECQDSKYSLSDILNYIALYPSKEAEFQMIKGSFIKEAPKPADPGKSKQPMKMQLSLTKKVMTASEYRKILAGQIQAMAGMPDDDEVEVNVNSEKI